jgi:hypothetical protein
MLRRSVIASAIAMPLVLASGCAGIAPAGERFIAMPVGTVLTFSRASSGSFGSAGGQVVWTYGESTWQGRRVLDARNSVGTGTLHDPETFGVIANLNNSGQPTMSYEPPVALEWPLQVGKTWTTKHTVTVYPTGQKLPFENTWNVEAFEKVTVPAGTFSAFRVVRTGSDGEVETRWVGLELGVPLVKRVTSRTAAHRQGEGSQEADLVAVRVPGR